MNKQDQEERRLALKAAGYDGPYNAHQDERFNKIVLALWNPRKDRAHSFNLMMACNITITRHKNAVMIESDRVPGVVFSGYADQADSFMNAIFLCAVRIGREMEAGK